MLTSNNIQEKSGADPIGLRPQSEGFPQRAHHRGGPTELNPLPAEGLREVLTQVMSLRYGDQPLFRRQYHWQAVFRVMVDYHWCNTGDYDRFGFIVSQIMPEKVNAPYKRDSVKSISQTMFQKPFCEWYYERVMCGSRRAYDRMCVLTQKLFELVDANGLKPDNV